MKDSMILPSSERRQFLINLASWTAAAALLPYSDALLAATPHSASLTTKVNQYIKGLRRSGKIRRDEKTSWSVYDFTSGKKLLAINEDVPRQAASMIKPFIVQAFFFRASKNKGGLRYTRSARDTMEQMIRYSSNSATNRLIQQISRNSGNRGPRDVERVLKRYAPHIFKQTRIIERIPQSGRTYRNMASAHDYSRFLYAVWKDRIPYSEEMKELLALPNRDRLVDGVADIPRQTVAFDKTGTTARLCGDMGILEVPARNGKSYPYTLIAIIEKSRRARNYTEWASSRSKVIRGVSNIVYLEMKKRHPLV